MHREASVCFVDAPVDLGYLQADVYEAIDLLTDVAEIDCQQIALKVLIERFNRFTDALERQGVAV